MLTMAWKRLSKKRHVLSSSSDDDGPIPAKRPAALDSPLTPVSTSMSASDEQRMIEDAVIKALERHPRSKRKRNTRERSLSPRSSSQSDAGPSISSGKYIRTEDMLDIFPHVRSNLCFSPFQVDIEGKGLFPQYVKSALMAMPFHDRIKDLALSEWKELDKSQVPTFLLGLVEF